MSRKRTPRRLEGWNHIPAGYGASFDTDAAPWWLRNWFFTPFIDRYAYPKMVERGLGLLTEQPGMVGDEDAARAAGWRIIRDDSDLPPSHRQRGQGWLS